MDLEKRYLDIDDNECNILQLMKREPEWAANMIQWYEKKLSLMKISALKAGYVELPTVETIEGMVWDANKYWGCTKRPRSMFIAEWVLDSIKLGLYSDEENNVCDKT